MVVALAVVAIAMAVTQPADASCRSHACWQRVHQHRRQAWAREHPWQHAWNSLGSSDRLWLRSTAWCESRNNPRTNTGNGFYGLVQFTLTTAWAAGFRTGADYTRRTARADLASWYEQAVRAVRWMHVAGHGQWPVCG